MESRGLMREVLGVERGMGRERVGAPVKGPRVIDLDLLLYGDWVLWAEELILPHPRMEERRFLLEPFGGIAPEGGHPVLGGAGRGVLAGFRGDSLFIYRAPQKGRGAENKIPPTTPKVTFSPDTP